MDEMRVPKRRVTADVVMAGGAARRVELFLSEAAEGHAGPERPSDLLNASGEFLPALDAAGGRVAFLNRNAVAVVRLAAELEHDVADEPIIRSEHEVAVTLADGTELRGLVSYLRPRAVRLVEFLNEPAPFLELRLGDAVALVNKRQVARIELLSP